MPTMEMAFRVAAHFSEKAHHAVAGRMDWASRLEFALGKAPPGPRVMLHAPSVGEFLQGRAVLDELLDRHPNLVVVITHFSPSAGNIVAAYDRAVARTILPFDNLRNMQRLLDIVRPDILVFSRADVWPNLVGEAHRRGVPTVLVAGTLSQSAGRLNPIAAGFASEGLRLLDMVATISDDDSAQFIKLGVDANRVKVTGDPRFDQTWRRAQSVTDSDPLFRAFRGGVPTLVAGSTWPPDERAVLPAFAAVEHAVPGIRLIVAPHEPTPARVNGIIKGLRRKGLSVSTLSKVESGSDEKISAVVVDRVGILAKLYYLGSVAFVGGSFVRRVHNVMEPACMGIPVLVGPRHENAREAQLLIKAGGAFCVKDSKQMEKKLLDMFRDDPARKAAGQVASEYVCSNLGAARVTAEFLEKYFPGVFDKNSN